MGRATGTPTIDLAVDSRPFSTDEDLTELHSLSRHLQKVLGTACVRPLIEKYPLVKAAEGYSLWCRRTGNTSS